MIKAIETIPELETFRKQNKDLLSKDIELITLIGKRKKEIEFSKKEYPRCADNPGWPDSCLGNVHCAGNFGYSLSSIEAITPEHRGGECPRIYSTPRLRS
jgi:hypothetical protein